MGTAPLRREIPVDVQNHVRRVRHVDADRPVRPRRHDRRVRHHRCRRTSSASKPTAAPTPPATPSGTTAPRPAPPSRSANTPPPSPESPQPLAGIGNERVVCAPISGPPNGAVRIPRVRHPARRHRVERQRARAPRLPEVAVDVQDHVASGRSQTPRSIRCVPAGTSAAFATTLPVQEFSVETFGCACPVGQVVR